MNRTIALFTTICFILSSFPCVYAMESTPETEASDSETNAAKTVISAEEYFLMPGDSILITITGSTHYSYLTGVTLEGKVTINMPVSSMSGSTSMLGSISEAMPKFDIVEAVPVYSLSINAAKDSLHKVFLKYFKAINVDITLIGMRTFLVHVAGEVNRSGIALARPIYRVSTVLDTIGGVSALGSRSHIQLIRQDSIVQYVDLEEFARTGNPNLNPLVQDGDLIFVPKIEKSVLIIGAIYGRREYGLLVPELLKQATETTIPGEKTTQGIYELIEGERVSDMIDKAGITAYADLSNIYVQRKDERLNIDFRNVLADESCADNILMEDGDILYVPTINAVVYVQGQVVNPGPYVFQPNLKASDYVGMAGGALDEASMTESYVRRGTTRIAMRKDPIIEKGDQIIVPRQLLKFWQDYFYILSTVGSLILSYLTLQAITK